MRYLTFGEVMLRLSSPGTTPLTQALPGPLEASFGGAEANVAVALAALGAPAALLTALPDNPLGRACLRALAGRGVETDRILLREGGRLGLYFLESGAAFRPSRVVYDRAGSSFALTGPEDYQWNRALADCGWLHVSGITPALGETSARALGSLVEQARAAEISISLDLNYRSRLWRWQEGTRPEALARQVMLPLAREARVIIGNEEDASRVLGLQVPGLDLSRGDLDPLAYGDLTRQVARTCPRAEFVAFSLRRSLHASRNLWGGILLDVAADRIHYHPTDPEAGFAPLDIDPVVDRVGGGDAFAAGLIYGLGHSRALPAEALGLAVAAGGLAQTCRGDWLEADLEMVAGLARGETSGRIKR